MKTYTNKLTHFIHKHFFYFIIGSYIAGGLFPRFGLFIRDTHFGTFTFFDGSKVKLSLALIMLSILLFNAGLGIIKSELTNLFKQPKLLLVGLVANLSIPIVFTVFISITMTLWHNPDEVQNILVGLALIASMPIAASSTAWVQKTNGNLALSLGLVIFSTMFSPITTPLGLHSIGFITVGDYSEKLHALAGEGTGAFLFISVLLPSLLGIGLHFVFKPSVIIKTKEPIKDINLVNLILLNYANASVALPQVFTHPDWDFLLVIGIITCGLCIFAFFSGNLIARVFKSSESEKVSLMFGLAMNNNGTGLVLASLSLAGHPSVMLPIIFYNLIQHMIAGIAEKRFYSTGKNTTSD
ncbi:hypothetical protein LPTSP3_g02330 [Leptospira kobayashii]|uniref:Sodium Bile acid symporter family protein n=1 Tax=Leptospira kobayashii TaxID=1917830 RepID=A0ABN6K928_9LEPT|nr:bile acid:sodium symporter [Leptospira kobayashii]BDA77303.1 hypothetical protein LPTSP3_g02330 [Leptospira kobayashii]